MAWLYKQKESQNWWIGYRVNGRQFCKSTGTPDRAKAEQELSKLRALFEAHKASMLEEAYHALSGKSLPRHSLKAAAELWLKECSATTAAGTFDKYAGIANEFCVHVGAGPEKPLIHEITSEQARSFLQDRRTTRTASTANLERKILSIFFRWAIENKMLRENPMVSVKRFKASSKETKIARRAFTVSELQLLYAKAPSDFWRYMILTGFFTGLRMGNIITLAWESIDLTARMIHCSARKTGTPVHIPIAPELEKFYRDLHTKAGTPKRGFIWPDEAEEYESKGSGPFSNAFYDEVLAPCGLVPVRTSKQKKKDGRSTKRELNAVSFHCFHHTFVTMVKMISGSQAVAKELAGHSSDIVSDLYTHVPERELRNTVQALPAIAAAGHQLPLFPQK